MRLVKNILISIFVIACISACCYFALPKSEPVAATSGNVIRSISGGFEGRHVNDAQQANELISDVGDSIGFGDSNMLALNNVASTAIGTVYRYDQYYKGLEVYGRQVILIVDNDGLSDSINANYYQGLDMDVIPNISESQARQVLYDNGYTNQYNANLIIYTIDVEPTLAYYIEVADGDKYYAYFVNANDGDIIDRGVIAGATNVSGSSFEILGDMVYVDTLDYWGETVNIPLLYDEDPNNDGDSSDARYYLADDYRNIILFVTDQTDVSRIDGSIATSVYATSTDLSTLYTNNGSIAYTGYDATRLISTYYNTILSYDYYMNSAEDWLVKDGLYEKDDHMWQKHYTEVFAYVGSSHYNNAWSSTSYNSTKSMYITSLFFGNGYCNPGGEPTSHDHVSEAYYYFGASMDVVAHEYQHSMTAFTVSKGASSDTLTYSGESGAINEAISDIFAIIAEGDYDNDSLSNNEFWYIADEISLSRQSGMTYLQMNCMRNIKNPGYIFTNPSYYTQVPTQYKGTYYYTGTEDEGGVHTNSSVVSYMAYKMYAQGLYSSIEDMASYWYAVLNILPKDCTMYELGEYMLTVGEGLRWNATQMNKLCSVLNDVKLCRTEGEHVDTYTYYTVTFVDRLEGGETRAYTVRRGDSLTAPVFERHDANFVGWVDEDNADVDIVSALSSVSADVTYYAKWSDRVTLTFYVGEDSSIVTVRYGENATAPEDPTDDVDGKRFRFLGWADYEGNIYEDMDAELTDVRADKTYYASIEYIRYHVTFLLDGKKLLAGGSFDQYILYGESAIVPASNPSKEGYDFIEWDKPYNNIVEDTAVNAVMQIQSYEVKFFKANTYNEITRQFMYTLVSTQTVEYMSAATPPVVNEWVGDFYFNGWNKDYTSIKGDVDIYPVYSYGIHEVTFVDQDQETVVFIRHGESIQDDDLPEITPMLGFDTSWNYNGGAINADTTITVKYDRVSYTVTFMLGDEEFSMQVKYNEEIDRQAVIDQFSSKKNFFQTIEIEETSSITENKTVTVRIVTDYTRVVLVAFGSLIVIAILWGIIAIARDKKSKN